MDAVVVDGEDRREPVLSSRGIRERRMALRRGAHTIVRRAIEQGRLTDPRSLDCADCGDHAEVYDHRDYRKPLAVVPVCASCNAKRGQAEPPCPRPDAIRGEQVIAIPVLLTTRQHALLEKLRMTNFGHRSVEELLWRTAMMLCHHGVGVDQLISQNEDLSDEVAALEHKLANVRSRLNVVLDAEFGTPDVRTDATEAA